LITKQKLNENEITSLKKKKKKLEAQLPAKQRLKDDLKKKSIFKKDKKI
jgi:hypothetical protein